MRTSRIGGSDVSVTELSFGAAALGNLFTEVGDEQARAAVDAAWAAGVRYFDTAPHYGLGLSERRLGAALRERPRSEYVLSTKVGRLLEPQPEAHGDDPDAGGHPRRPRRAAAGACRSSKRRWRRAVHGDRRSTRTAGRRHCAGIG